MAESVVSFVVEKLGNLLIQETLLLAGVSDQVRQMQTELQRMQRFLQDADSRQDEKEEEEVVRGWVSEIRELAYDAENVIETFILEIASRRQNGFSKKFKRYATIFIEVAKIHKLGTAIEAIQGRITSLTTSLTTYGIQTKTGHEGTSSVPTRRQPVRRSYSHVVENRTVGLDEALMILVPKLVVKEDRFVISICGMGGLGKTTLAKKLYHHEEVRNCFDAFAWSCISAQFQVRGVLIGILVKLSSSHRKEDILRMDDDEIAKEVYQIQKEKKCLVVLDDIWKEADWKALKHAFPVEEGVAGMIMFTTRNKSLASYADPNAFRYEPKTLTETESWDLLQAKLPARSKLNMADMEKLGREIVKKCAGLPLAIIVLGGVLNTKYSLCEWEKVHKNVESYLRRSKGNDEEYSVVDGVLALSYNELPYYLKPCFLHLGNFPEDHDIDCKTLLRMWAAEGFVSQCQHDDETMEDVAERYLDDLVDRSIVEVSQMGLMGRVKTCRLHDMMRYFCLSKANQENYLQIVRTTSLNDKPTSNRVHRLVVHPNDNKDIDLGYYARTPYLRSLLLFMNHTVWKYPIFKSRLSDFKLLKILSLERCMIGKKLGKEIGGLIHLRYLAFKYCEIKALPSSIGNLRYLHTLIVWGETTVPNILWKLEQLRHLILPSCIMEGGELLKLGNMRELKTLKTCRQINMVDTFIYFDVAELVNFSHLEKLAVVLNEDSNEIPSVTLGRLTSLFIINGKNNPGAEEFTSFLSSCTHLASLSYSGRIKNKLPACQHFPAILTKLTLEDCFLEEDPMPILEKLPNLRILRLRSFSFFGRLLVCSSKGFPKLQTLLLTGLTHLEEWTVDEEAMPNLSQLEIICCKKLNMIPEGIKFITTLRQLKIRLMPKIFAERVRVIDEREGGDFYKVRHVPSIIIQYTLNYSWRLSAPTV